MCNVMKPIGALRAALRRKSGFTSPTIFFFTIPRIYVLPDVSSTETAIFVCIGGSVAVLLRSCSNLNWSYFVEYKNEGWSVHVLKMGNFSFFSAFSTRSHYHIPAIFPILHQTFGEFGNYSDWFFKNSFSVTFFWNFRNTASFCSKNHRNRLSEHGERVSQSLQLATENVHTQ